jgi:hypothetical protein
MAAAVCVLEFIILYDILPDSCTQHNTLKKYISFLLGIPLYYVII